MYINAIPDRNSHICGVVQKETFVEWHPHVSQFIMFLHLLFSVWLVQSQLSQIWISIKGFLWFGIP